MNAARTNAPAESYSWAQKAFWREKAVLCVAMAANDRVADDLECQNGKIYKITALGSEGPFYVGSTCQELSTRLSGHQGALAHRRLLGQRLHGSESLIQGRD